MNYSISVRDNGDRVRTTMRFVQTGLTSALGGIGMAVSGLSLDLGNAVVPASALVSFVILWNFYSWHLLGRKSFGLYGLFLLSASMFHGSQAVLEVVGLNPNGVLGGQFPPELTVKALYLAALGLSALHLGAIYAVCKNPANGRFRTHPADIARNRASRIVGWFCIGLGAVPTAMIFMDRLSIIASRGYAGMFARPRDEMLPGIIEVLATGIIPGIMFLAVGIQKRSFGLKVLFGIVITYSGIQVLEGMRGTGFLLLVSFAWLYHTRVRQLSGKVLLVAGVAFLAVSSIVAVARSSQSSWRESVEARASDSVYDLVVASATEMGGTLGTVAHTINLVPSAHSFDYGMSYVYALSTLMPNIGWDVHPAVGHQYATWLVTTVAPMTAARGGGLGYSFLAEVFANFGWYGIVPVLALMGYLLVRMNDWAALTYDPIKSAAVASFMVFLLFFPRAESAAVVRPLVYYSLLPYAAVGLLGKKRGAALRMLPKSQVRLAPLTGG